MTKNGIGWNLRSHLDALVELVLHGEYNGMFGEKRSKDGMELRAAALGVIQVSFR